jgi:hypothetical protein
MKKITLLGERLNKAQQKMLKGGITIAMANCVPGAWNITAARCFTSFYQFCVRYCGATYCASNGYPGTIVCDDLP